MSEHIGGALDRELMGFFRTMQSMDTLYEEYARKNGLTYMSLYILETLYEYRRCTQKDISQTTLYPKQTVNMVIRGFQQKGWVTLEPEETDRRSKCVCLTAAGYAFAQRVVEPYWEAGLRAFGTLEEGRRKAILQGLRAYAGAFEQEIRKL